MAESGWGAPLSGLTSGWEEGLDPAGGGPGVLAAPAGILSAGMASIAASSMPMVSELMPPSRSVIEGRSEEPDDRHLMPLRFCVLTIKTGLGIGDPMGAADPSSDGFCSILKLAAAAAAVVTDVVRILALVMHVATIFCCIGSSLAGGGMTLIAEPEVVA